MISIAGARLGGWAATRAFPVHSLQGFFNASTWLTAITGAAVLLVAHHLAIAQVGQSRHAGWFAHR
jgi:hypothetical protein